jgi:hypothetical protein
VFREAMFQEAMQALLQGYVDDGRSALRVCINATIGFEKLATALDHSPKSLMRMFGPSGNPTAENRSVSAHDTSVRENSFFRYIDRAHRGEVDIGRRSIHMHN